MQGNWVGNVIFLFCAIGLMASGREQNPMDTISSRYISILLDSAAYYQTNHPKKTLAKIREAMALALRTGHRQGETMAIIALGEYYFRQSLYAQAVEQATQALKQAEEQYDTLAMAMAHRLLGLVFTLGLKQYPDALKHQQQAYRFFQILNDPRNIAANCGNITWIYAVTGTNLEEAMQIANRGVALADSLNDYQLLSYNHNSKGLIFKALGQTDSAIFYFDLSNRAARQVNEQAVYAYNATLMADIALKQGNLKQAMQLLNEAAGISAQLNLREILKDSYKGLSDVYARQGNFAKAYEHRVLHEQLKDSLLNWEIVQRAILANNQLEYERQMKQLATLELRAQRVQREQLIISIAFAFVFILMGAMLVMALRNNRYRKQINEALLNKNKLIEAQNRELKISACLRDKLFSVISHDLRSPLVSLRGLLTMLQKKQITEREFALFIPRLNQLLLGMNETLENLLKWGHSQLGLLSFQPVQLHIHDVVNQVFRLFNDIAEHKKIKLINQTPARLFVTADQNVMELLLRNLIHNALKFSQPGGKVTVTAQSTDAECSIEVHDLGIGLPEDFMKLLATGSIVSKRGTSDEKGTGLGLRLCTELLERQGGRLEAYNRQEGGATFRITLKM